MAALCPRSTLTSLSDTLRGSLRDALPCIPLSHSIRGSLEDVLRFGQLPLSVTSSCSEEKIEFLDAYVETYLKEEIQQKTTVTWQPTGARNSSDAAHATTGLAVAARSKAPPAPTARQASA